MCSKELLRKSAERDLGICTPFIKSEEIEVKNCWHFSTDGNAIDVIYRDDDDLKAGMNRIFVVSRKFNLLILAFCLMDNHLHFVLYGDLRICNDFMHEYIRLTSMYISHKYEELHSLYRLPVHYQQITDQNYLKKAIAYVIRNPVAAGMEYIYLDYPWSSGALYFRKTGNWTSLNQTFALTKHSIKISSLHIHERRSVLRTRNDETGDAYIMGDVVFPGEYVETGLVERVFRTHKSFNYFLSVNKEEEIDRKGGIISRLSLSDREMRQHKFELSQEMYGVKTFRTLSMDQRIRLARVLKMKYNSSSKQIARICGLAFKEVADLL